MKKIVLVAATLASVNVAASQADMGSVYVGGRMHIVNYDVDVAGALDIDSGVGFGIVAGVPFVLSEQLSMGAEVGYVRLGAGEGDEADEYEKYEYELSGNSLYGVATANFHATEQLSLFGKAGLSKTTVDIESTYFDYEYDESERTSSDESDMGLTYGFGAKFNVNDQLALVGEYTYFGEVEKIEVSSFSAGVNYKF